MGRPAEHHNINQHRTGRLVMYSKGQSVKRTFHTMAAAIAVAAPISAASAQDVSFGIDGLVGQVDDNSVATGPDHDFTVAALPSAQVGLGDVTVQADGMLADHRGSNAHGGALHLGTKVSGGKTYLGVYGSASDHRRDGGLTTYRVGAEVDFDLGTVGLTSVAGYEETDARSTLAQTTTTHNIFDQYNGEGRFFAFTDLRFRPSQSLRISVGQRYTGGLSAASAGIAVGLGSNVALMAEGRLGQHDYNAALVGLRVRFGGTSAGNNILDNRLMEDLFAPANTRSTLSVALPPPEDNGCGSCGGYCEA